MKRYLIFAGYDHSPAGGWLNFIHDFEEKSEVMEFLARRKENNDWIHVFDTKTQKLDWVKGYKI